MRAGVASTSVSAAPGGGRDKHQRSHRRQGRARPPQAIEQGGGASPRRRPDGAWGRIHERLI
jgi:hypothetical protein